MNNHTTPVDLYNLTLNEFKNNVINNKYPTTFFMKIANTIEKKHILHHMAGVPITKLIVLNSPLCEKSEKECVCLAMSNIFMSCSQLKETLESFKNIYIIDNE